MLNIKIKTDNDAFKDALEEETIQCLEEVIGWLKVGRLDNPIFDTNGNNVGYFKLTK